MKDTTVILHDGKVLAGSIWEWSPQAGYFVLTDNEGVNNGAPIRVQLSTVAKAVTRGVQENVFKATDRDELARARREGWDGK